MNVTAIIVPRGTFVPASMSCFVTTRTMHSNPCLGLQIEPELGQRRAGLRHGHTRQVRHLDLVGRHGIVRIEQHGRIAGQLTAVGRDLADDLVAVADDLVVQVIFLQNGSRLGLGLPGQIRHADRHAGHIHLGIIRLDTEIGQDILHHAGDGRRGHNAAGDIGAGGGGSVYQVR